MEQIVKLGCRDLGITSFHTANILIAVHDTLCCFIVRFLTRTARQWNRWRRCLSSGLLLLRLLLRLLLSGTLGSRLAQCLLIYSISITISRDVFFLAALLFFTVRRVVYSLSHSILGKIVRGKLGSARCLDCSTGSVRSCGSTWLYSRVNT